MCESSEENAEHLIYKCGKTDRLGKYISSIIMNCISLDFEITCFDKIAYMPLQVEHQEFINMLLTLGRWSIWKIRNIKHYEGKMFSDTQSLSLMKYEIKTHMEINSSGNSASRQTKECVGRIITFIDMWVWFKTSLNLRNIIEAMVCLVGGGRAPGINWRYPVVEWPGVVLKSSIF